MNLTNEELNIARKEIVDKLGTKFLYQYRADNEYTENIIKNSALWFSRPSEFNDPFECYSILSSFSDRDVEKWLNTKESFLNATTNKQEEARNRVMSMTENIKIKDSIDRKLNDIGISCFCKTEKEVLMWSHYSDKHKGMCFQFNVEKDPNLFLLPYFVEYVPSISPKNYFLKQSNEFIRQFITTKCYKWCYEQEIRVIKFPEEMSLSNADKGKAFEYKPEALRKIIFGCKASKETISKYKDDLCANYGFGHVKFSQMQQKKDGTFELEETSLY